MTPTQAAPMIPAVHEKAPEMIRFPWPGWPMRLSAGTSTSRKWTRGVTTPLAEFVVDGDHLDAGRVAGDGDHGEGLARPLGGVGPADDRVQVSAAAVPAGPGGRVVLLAGDDQPVAVAPGDRLDPGGGVLGVVVGAAADVGEGERGEKGTVDVVDERLEEPALLLGGAELDDGLEAETGGQERRGDVDVDPGEFLCGDGEGQHAEPEAAGVGGDERLGESRLGDLSFRRAMARRLPSG